MFSEHKKERIIKHLYYFLTWTNNNISTEYSKWLKKPETKRNTCRAQ